MFISVILSINLKRAFLDLMREFKDVFTWTYFKMTELDS